MGRPRKHHKGLPERVTLKHGAYFFLKPVTKNGKPGIQWIRLGTTLSEAMANWTSIIQPCEQIATVSDLINRYLKEVAPTKAPRTWQDNMRQAEPLRAFFGQMKPADLRPIHVYQYLDIRGKTAPIPANREKALLSHIYTMAIRWGIVDANPCRGVKRIPERPRDRCPTPQEIKAFLEHAPDLIRAYVAVKVLTGLRQADLLAIHRDQLKGEGIHLREGKTGKRRIIEWTPALREAINGLKALKRPITSMHLFCNRRGQPYKGSGFRSIWQRAMKKALANGKLTERFTEHDLRAFVATTASREGLDVQSLLGHANQATTLRYVRRKEAQRTKPLR